MTTHADPSAARPDGPGPVRSDLPPVRIRRIPHRTGKFFGFPDEKWARGGGANGYGGNYGHYSHCQMDLRTRAEMANAVDRTELTRLAPDGLGTARDANIIGPPRAAKG